MPEAQPKGEIIFKGIPVSAGVCRGKILVVDRQRPSIGRRVLSDAELAEEVNRLERALVQTRHQILEVQRRVSEGMGTEEGSIFDAHLLVLEDRTLQRAATWPNGTLLQSNYLAQQAGKVHIFRQRIPIHNVDPSAY